MMDDVAGFNEALPLLRFVKSGQKTLSCWQDFGVGLVGVPGGVGLVGASGWGEGKGIKEGSGRGPG